MPGVPRPPRRRATEPRSAAPTRTSAPARACLRCADGARLWANVWQTSRDRQPSPASCGRSWGRQLQQTEVGATGREDRVDIDGGRDVSAGDRGDASFIADPIGGRNTKQAPVVRATLPDRLTFFGVAEVTAV